MNIDLTDEITAGATITHQGKVVHPATAEALGIKPPEQPAPEPPAADPPAAEPAAEPGTDAPAEAGERKNA
jgi:hypothetical protein